MEKYICIHGHFYQPPRENPWLEEIEFQESAYPYHDWNERINAECYAPNTASRILTPEGKVIVIGNNYSRISFNFGPTLLAWMEKHAKDIYDEIINADRVSRERYSGHGSALAQAYNHLIMPLANGRDKFTQALWGVRDFQERFGRDPEGMWLPETAADLETLDILAGLGIKFTVLSPYQAKRAKNSSGDWYDVNGGKIDPRMPYACRLPSGRTISLFFYDGPISRDIAFGGLLKSGEAFANRLLSAFGETGDPAQLVHIATDGETYGHHHQFGDMALGYCLHYIETNKLAKITNYGEYLEKFPPAREAGIFENSSWSCPHGVERWRSNCGCSTGGRAGWKQEWRKPLREAMDWLRDTLAPLYEQEVSKYVKDPWAARNDYIDVILDRSTANICRFFEKHTARNLNEGERITLMKLLEMQRNAMLMYTSCGWFFDEISGIETTQVLQYACRAIQLGEELAHIPLEPAFMKYLETAESNILGFGNGSDVYAAFAKPARVDFLRVGAHYAISAIFDEYPECINVYCYNADADLYTKREMGKFRLFICRVRLSSMITGEHERISAAVLHMGDHNVNCGVGYCTDGGSSAKMHDDMVSSFDEGNILEVVRFMERYFGAQNYSLPDLFKDEQRKFMNKIVKPTIDDIDLALRQGFSGNCLIIDFYRTLNLPVPKKLLTILGYRVNSDLERCFEEDAPVEEFKRAVEDARQWSLDLDRAKFSLLGSTWINEKMQDLENAPDAFPLLRKIGGLLGVMSSASIPLNLWKSQNIYYRIDSRVLADMRKKASGGDLASREWVDAFRALGERMNIQE